MLGVGRHRKKVSCLAIVLKERVNAPASGSFQLVYQPGDSFITCVLPATTPSVWHDESFGKTHDGCSTAVCSFISRLVRLCDRQTTSLKMSAKHDEETKVARAVDTESPPPTYGGASVQDDQAYVYKDDQKLGYTATVFVILNKMIGTGSMYTPLLIFNTHSYQAQFFPLRPVSSQSLALLAYPFSSGL
jgi:hypothetical protein